MTIDEIKQALQEAKEYCLDSIENSESPWLCDACPLAIDHMGHKRCPMRYMNGDLRLPFEWPLDWPEDARIAKANATDPLTLNDYQRMARRTAGDKRKSDKMEEALFGLAGEVGELCDHYKKYMHQGHDIDYDHMAEEAGDVMWYLAESADALGMTLEDIARRNIDKLLKRYPEGFDPERSMHREE